MVGNHINHYRTLVADNRMASLDNIIHGSYPMDNNTCGCGAIFSLELINCPQCGEYCEVSVEVEDLNTGNKTYIR